MHLARRLAPWRCGGGRAQHPGLVVPPGGVVALDAAPDVGAVKAAEPTLAKSIIAASPLAARSRPKAASHVDDADGGAVDVRKDRRRLPVLAFLQHKLIGAQPKRISRQLHGNMIVAAQLELVGCVEVTFGHVEFDLAGNEHIGRSRDNGGRCPELTFRRFDFHDRTAPVYASDRRRESERRRARAWRAACPILDGRMPHCRVPTSVRDRLPRLR